MSDNESLGIIQKLRDNPWLGLFFNKAVEPVKTNNPHPADTEVRFVTLNLNFGRDLSTQIQNVNGLRAKLIGFQEAVGRMKRDEYITYQPRRRNGEWAGEGILVHKSLTVLDSSFHLVAENNYGEKIQDRFIVRVRIKTRSGPLDVFIWHNVPKRMQTGTLGKVYLSRAKSIIGNRTRFLFGGDHNMTGRIITESRWVGGAGIDRWWSGVDSDKMVQSWKETQNPLRADGHPAVYITVEL